MNDEFEHIHMASPSRLAEMLENSRSDLFSTEFRELLTESADRLRSLMQGLRPDDKSVQGLPPTSEIYAMNIEDCDFSVRLTNILTECNIETVGVLVLYNPRSFLRIRNFGKKSLMELREFGYRYGLTFGHRDVNERF